MSSGETESLSRPAQHDTPRFDELRDASGIRSEWKPLIEALASMPRAEFARRREQAQAMIRDNGVTYNVYDEAEGQARPWQLDITPFVIGAADWKVIEAGVVQRAELSNRVLADIYGPQSLIADGHLPAHLVFGHPQFLRPLVGVTPPGGVHVHLYSADLARMPDGSWTVLSSRCDAPSGIGYALENRIAMNQTFAELFGEMRVQRLATFFNSYRETVANLAQSLKGRAVLMTPGPHNEAYFEHAYLSHYLGLTLVEGEDLAVRDGQVFLKTLTGLERVAMIFRRVDSDFCDPLEFRGDSALGIPGLADAVRSGNVVLANALGGGVMESPAIDAYMPNLCRALLGEDLKMADIPTVWCGTEWGREEALSRLDRVILRDAFDARPLFSRNSTARLGSELSPAEIEAFKEKLKYRGATFVTQDVVPLGLAPAFEGGVFRAHAMSLRVFAAWTPDGYKVMPGGLIRITRDDNARALSMQSGASSKDAWVIGEGPVDNFSLLRQAGRSVDIKRTGEAPPSRAMDNLFWLGRYAERAENLVRVLRAVVLRLGEDSRGAAKLAQSFVTPLAPASHSALVQAADGDDARLALELRSLIYDRRSEDGLQRLLGRVRQTAWAARDRLSPDTWRTIHMFTEDEAPLPFDRALDPAETSRYLDMLIRRAAAFSGLCAENMTRGPNWLFTDLGRRVERLAHMAWLVRQTASMKDEIEQVRVALEIADSAMTYRSRYLNQFQLPPLIDLLLLDRANPRSCAFQLFAIETNLRELPLITPVQRREGALEIASALRVRLDEESAASLIEPDETGVRRRLNGFSEEIEDESADISNAISAAYFQHTTRRRTGAAPKEAG